MSTIQKKLLAFVGLLLTATLIIGIIWPFYEHYQIKQYPKVILSEDTSAENSLSTTFVEKNSGKSSLEDSAKPTETLKMGMASITAGRESLYYYEDLLKHLENQVGMPVEIHQTRTHSEMNELLRQGNIDVAFVCSYSYVLLKDEYDVPMIAAPQINGSNNYRSVIIAREELNINSFYELEGKTFAFTDPLSNAGKLYPLYLLEQRNSSPEDFFEHSYFTYSHDNSIDSVVEGVVDAAAVDSLVFDYLYTQNPEKFKQVELIHTSPTFGIPPIVASPQLDNHLKVDIKDFFLELDETSEGRHILDQLGINQFVTLDNEAYDSIRDMAEVVGHD